MLSTTWTIEDVKNKLKKTYDFYDFNSDDEFEAALIDIAEEVLRRIPREFIGRCV